MLIFCQVYHLTDTCGRKLFIKADSLHTGREKVKKNPFQLGGVDSPSVCRKACGKADMKASVFRMDGHGRAFQNFLTAPADADKAALAGAFGFKGVLFDFLVKKAVEVILEGHPFVPGIEEGAGEACCFSVNKDAQAGWRGKGISLYMVDG